MDSEDKYTLVEPFETDDGSMAEVTPEYAFALGVEWAMFRQKLLNEKGPFRTLCLPQNRQRFVRMAERHKRFVEDRQTPCASWFEIWVGDYLG